MGDGTERLDVPCYDCTGKPMMPGDLVVYDNDQPCDYVGVIGVVNSLSKSAHFKDDNGVPFWYAIVDFPSSVPDLLWTHHLRII